MSVAFVPSLSLGAGLAPDTDNGTVDSPSAAGADASTAEVVAAFAGEGRQRRVAVLPGLQEMLVDPRIRAAYIDAMSGEGRLAFARTVALRPPTAFISEQFDWTANGRPRAVAVSGTPPGRLTDPKSWMTEIAGLRAGKGLGSVLRSSDGTAGELLALRAAGVRRLHADPAIARAALGDRLGGAFAMYLSNELASIVPAGREPALDQKALTGAFLKAIGRAIVEANKGVFDQMDGRDAIELLNVSGAIFCQLTDPEGAFAGLLDLYGRDYAAALRELATDVAALADADVPAAAGRAPSAAQCNQVIKRVYVDSLFLRTAAAGLSMAAAGEPHLRAVASLVQAIANNSNRPPSMAGDSAVHETYAAVREACQVQFAHFLRVRLNAPLLPEASASNPAA